MNQSDESDVLHSEADWLETAHANSADKGYSVEFRKGFAAAARWVRLHAENPHLVEGRVCAAAVPPGYPHVPCALPFGHDGQQKHQPRAEKAT
jgi:hypothetical protein